MLYSASVFSTPEMVGMVLSSLLTTTGSASGLGLVCSLNVMMHAIQRHLPQFIVYSDSGLQAIEPKLHFLSRGRHVCMYHRKPLLWRDLII